MAQLDVQFPDPTAQHPLSSSPLLWDAESMSTFAFLMSRHGIPVTVSMMLGDNSYAREQLRLACTCEDHLLQQYAVRMLNALPYVTSPRTSAVQWSH